MRRAARFPVLALALLASAAVPPARAGKAAPQPAKPVSVIAPAEWDSLNAGALARRWVEIEAEARAKITRIETAPHPDTLDLTRAITYVAQAHYGQRLVNDGVVGDAIERIIALRTPIAPPGDKLLTWVHSFGSRYYEDVGRHDLALEHAIAYRTRIEAMVPLDTLTASVAHMRVGMALHQMEREPEARVAFQRSLDLARAKSGPAWNELVPALAEYASFLSDLGEFDAARPLLGEAREIAEKHTDPRSDRLEGVLARQTTLEQRVGNLADAVDLAQRSYELSRARAGEDDAATLRARVRLAYRLSNFGDHAEALRQLREIIPRMGDRIGRTNPQVVNARIAALEDAAAIGDTTGMRAELASLWPLVESSANPTGNAVYLHTMSSVLARLAGDEAAAYDTLERAIQSTWAERGRWGPRLIDVCKGQAQLLGAGDDARAATLFARADTLREFPGVRANSAWIDWLTARAGMESRLGLADSAWAHASAAARASAEMLRYQVFALSDHQALQFAEQSAEPCDVLNQLAATGDAARVGAAWQQLIHWRGMVREEVTSRRLAAWQAADTAVAGAHARWIAAQRHLAQLVVSGAAHPDDPATAALYAQARAAADAAEQRLGRRVGDAAADTVTLAHVLSHLSPGQALVGFATAGTGRGPRTLGAFVATAGGTPRWVTLGEEDAVAAAIAAWTSQLAAPPAGGPAAVRAAERACRVQGARVRELLWAPVLRALGAVRDVYVVPEASTWNVPWLALPAGERGYVADAPYVVHLLNAERELLRPALRAEGGLLAVGDPDFDRAGDAPADTSVRALRLRSASLPCAGGQPVRLEPLPAARAEVRAIAASWPARAGVAAPDLRVGDRADEAAFKREAPGRAVIHLATHGIVLSDTCGSATTTALRGVGGVATLGAPATRRAAGGARVSSSSPAKAKALPAPQAPGHVWLAFAGANHAAEGARDENEGLLTAEEVATLDLAGTDWVVLSACHSGVGETWLREGQSGMRRAFHLAGVRTVIASRWAVADAATREWMVALYGARARGLAAAPAVHSAAREVLKLRRADGRSTHPFFWAGFEASGQ